VAELLRTAVLHAGHPAGGADAGDYRRLADDDLYALLLIRHFEQKLLELFGRGHITGTTHTCIGQEYVPVALEPLLGDAFVFSNHRGHGHYLARFGDAVGLLAEITGRAGAVCGGYGGSQHIYRDGFCSTGIQGQSVPVAVGAALHRRRRGEEGVAVAYIGDGTWGEGAVYEALNLAALLNVPLVLVVENNGIAQSTPTTQAMAGSVAARSEAFGVRYERVDSTCVTTIREQIALPMARTRQGAGPLVIEFLTYRLGSHSKGDDTRPPDEVARLRERDWYGRYAQAHPRHFEEWDERVRREVDAVSDEVLARPPAAKASL
jgi:pyruvate dehydrogenase E1 component alpha subunit